MTDPAGASGGGGSSASRKREIPAWTRRPLERLSLIGVAPDDSDEVRVQKVTLTIASEVVTVLSVAWVGTYVALGLPQAAAIPFTYQAASVVTLIGPVLPVQSDRPHLRPAVPPPVEPRRLRELERGQPVGPVGVFGALFFFSARQAVPWFVVFVALTIFTGLIDPRLAASAPTIPTGVQVSFFVLNILGVSATAYLLLQYSVRARDAALAQ